MYYRADVYVNSILENSFIAGGIDVLKSKAKPFIEDKKVTQIVVSEVNEIGFFKIPKEIEKVIEKEMML